MNETRGVYTVTSLSGPAMTDGEIREALAEATRSKLFRALLKLLEAELLDMRDRASDPQSLKEGTQPHWCGAVDGLNGACLRIAEVVKSAQTGGSVP